MSSYQTRVRIMRAMNAQNVNIKTLASRLGQTPDHLGRVLGGRGPMTGSEISHIAEALSVDPEELLGQYECAKCGAIGNAPTHRVGCSDASPLARLYQDQPLFALAEV